MIRVPVLDRGTLASSVRRSAVNSNSKRPLPQKRLRRCCRRRGRDLPRLGGGRFRKCVFFSSSFSLWLWICVVLSDCGINLFVLRDWSWHEVVLCQEISMYQVWSLLCKEQSYPAAGYALGCSLLPWHLSELGISVVTSYPFLLYLSLSWVTYTYMLMYLVDLARPMYVLV